MLLTREEMTFDFGGARLDPQRDRKVLAWMMNQFLYGEVTGIQCGHWLYDAPDVDAARFFSRQAVEEFQHVDNFVRILGLLGEQPGPAHPMVRFLTSGMMPGSFEEHVCLEMAIGEGLVLMALYGVIDTIDHQEIRAILERAVKQEERHVDFGEQRTMEALRARPSLRHRLLGLSLVSLWAVRRLGGFMKTRLHQEEIGVLSRLPAFLEFTVQAAEKRLLRMGVLEKPLLEMSALSRSAAVAAAYGLSVLSLPRRLLPRRRLTETYLRDPALTRAVPSPSGDDPIRLVR
jgi:bacterioferritin (cytochrome b1)